MIGVAERARSAAVACMLIIALAGLAVVSGCSSGVQVNRSAAFGVVARVPADAEAYVPGQLVVTLADKGCQDGELAEAFRHELSVAGAMAVETLARSTDCSGTVLLVRLADADCAGDSLFDAARSLAGMTGAEVVQPNYRYCSAAGEADAGSFAEDGDVFQQYYLNGWDDHGADVAAAWGEVGATRKVDVAVLDTGVYVMQDRGVDGGYAVGERGFHQEFDRSNLDIDHAVDVVNSGGDSNLLPLVNEYNPYGDDNGHGTHVSAIIAANAKTDATPDVLPLGMAGVSQNARVIPVKVLDAAGEGSTADFIRAYDYLLGMVRAGELEDLHVINMSLSLSFGDEEGGDSAGREATGLEAEDDFGALVLESDVVDASPDSSLESKIEEAARLGIATVCAAGNEGSAARTYPSDYDACISVTALDRDGKNADYSNINQYKDISAPGTGIYSAWGSQADAYATLDGTSQAAAIVSGVLSMMWAKDPSLTVKAASDLIYETAQLVPDGDVSRALVASASSGGNGLNSAGLSSAANGSHGAIDAAAALARVGVSDGGRSASVAGSNGRDGAAGKNGALVENRPSEERPGDMSADAGAPIQSQVDSAFTEDDHDDAEAPSNGAAPIVALSVATVVLAVGACVVALARARSKRS